MVSGMLEATDASMDTRENAAVGGADAPAVGSDLPGFSPSSDEFDYKPIAILGPISLFTGICAAFRAADRGRCVDRLGGDSALPSWRLADSAIRESCRSMDCEDRVGAWRSRSLWREGAGTAMSMRRKCRKVMIA